MEQLRGNAVVGQSGGPTAAINATLAGVIRGTMECEAVGKLYGAKNGIEGVTMRSWLWRPSYAAIAENSGVRCYVHTVNDRETAEALLQSGVSAVYTDYLVLHED